MSDKDTIYRQDAIDAINAYLGLSAVSRTIQNMTSIQEILEKLPSASPDLSTFSDKLWKNAYERGKAEGRKKGKWLRSGSAIFPCECDQCGDTTERNTPFCPHCGADMTGGEEE